MQGKLAVQSRSSALLAGVAAELPLLIGVFPFGLIYGVLALEVGLPHSVAQAMSAIVFAGSSQFIAAQLIGVGTPGFVIVLTIAVVNLRHALYSASVAPYVQNLPNSWKGVLAYLLTDEAYAVTITNYEQRGKQPNGHWFFLGAGLTLWSTWQVSTAAGIFLGAIVPESWQLDFTLALTFIALMVPALKDKAGVTAALIAGVVAILLFSLPYKLGILAAALVGIVAGLIVEQRR